MIDIDYCSAWFIGANDAVVCLRIYTYLGFVEIKCIRLSTWRSQIKITWPMALLHQYELDTTSSRTWVSCGACIVITQDCISAVYRKWTVKRLDIGNRSILNVSSDTWLTVPNITRPSVTCVVYKTGKIFWFLVSMHQYALWYNSCREFISMFDIVLMRILVYPGNDSCRLYRAVRMHQNLHPIRDRTKLHQAVPIVVFYRCGTKFTSQKSKCWL